MKKIMNFSKLAITALVTSGLFVACSDEISENTVDTKYTAQTSNIGNAGEAVDLGLPSGTLWANKNVGASSESDNGILFIWGDITGKKIDADNDASYKDVTGQTSLTELFGLYTGEVKDDGEICDTTSIVKISQPKLIDTSSLTDPAEVRTAVLAFIKDKLAETKKSSTGKGVLEATLVNDDSWTVIVNLNGDEYTERIPSDNESDPDKYYADYLPNKVSSLTINEISTTKVTYSVSPWANSYADVKDVFGKVIRKDYTAGTIGNSIKDIADSKKNGNLTFVPAYRIYKDAAYDAATANWGNGWRMPTTVELAELLNSCKWEIEGAGYKVTGPNGNSIFLPAAGYRYGEKQYGIGHSGYYASGEIIGTYSYPSMKAQFGGSKGEFSSTENMPSVLVFQQGQYNSIGVYNNMSASYGFSIRPVKQ